MSDYYLNIPDSGSPQWKAPVGNAGLLPSSGNNNGDVRITLNDDSIYIWNGTSWQLAATPAASSAITGLIGDVTATGPGVVTSTVQFVGGQSASSVATSVLATEAATPSDTPNTIVERDGSGNFSAGTITASLTGNVLGNLTGNVTGNVSGSSSSFTGSLSGDVTGTQSTTSIASTVVTGKLLTGYVTGTNTPITATNSILIAFENLQAQISAASGSAITALTGDGTATGPGSVPFTLATVNSNVGSFGSSTAIPSFTVNSKGLITAASINSVVAPAGTLTGTTLATNVLNSSLTSVGTISSGTWQGTNIAIGFGGTGQSTQQAAITSLTGFQTSGYYLRSNGTNAILSPIQVVDVPTLNQNTTGTASNITATSNSTLTSLPSLVLPTSQLSGTISLTSQVSGTLPIINGGTNLSTTPLNGQLLIGNGVNYTLSPLTGTTNQVIVTNGSGTITLSLPQSIATTSSPTFANLTLTNPLPISSGGTGSATQNFMDLTTNQTAAGNKTFSGQTAISNSSTDALTINGTSFVFDATNNTLGIGIQPATNTTLDTINTLGVSKAIQNTSYGVGSSIPFRGRFARGTIISPSAAQSGDNLSVYSGRGYGTSQFASASTGTINIVAGETFTNTSNHTYIQFQTTPSGSVTVSESMRIDSSGVTLGPQSGSTAIHQINGGIYRTTRTITGNLTIDTTTTDDIIFCNQSAGITITLPIPTNGRTISIKDISGTANTNNITVAQHSTEKIEGIATSKILQTNFGGWTFSADGTNWWMI